MRTRELILMTVALLLLPAALLVGAQQEVPLAAPAAQPDQDLVEPGGGEPDSHSGIVRRWQRVDGRFYSQWTTAWWQWATAFAPDENPILDPDGTFADQGQSGPMYFLAGTFGGDPGPRAGRAG